MFRLRGPPRHCRRAGARGAGAAAERRRGRGDRGLIAPEAARVAILNGFGRALGDGIIGLQALSVALSRGVIAPDPVLYRLPGLPAIQRALYAAAAFAEVRTLPWRDATPARGFVPAGRFGRAIDLRDFALEPAFRGVAMIDFFLGRLGLDPAAIPPAERRNAWLARHVTPAAPPAPPGYALLCGRASMKLRTMPHPIIRHIASCLRGRGWRVRLPSRSRTLAALCGQVAGASLVVSTDTAMVHLADAFGVPCLGFFPTHRPVWRVRDYPRCRGIHLPARDLPEALEFARGPADLEAARRAWFPHGRDLSWLDAALDLVLGSTAWPA